MSEKISRDSLTLIDWRSIRNIIGFHCQPYWQHLAPYAEKSYQHYLNDAKEYGIADAERYATDKTLKEIKQGVQSYTYELAQTQNALGQTP